MNSIETQTSNFNDIDSLESHLLFLGVNSSDNLTQISEDKINHKIDAKNIEMIKWSKLQSLISDILTQYNQCQYELRIYNCDEIDTYTYQILSNIKSIASSLNSTSEIIKMKQGIFGIFFEFLFTPINNNDNDTKSILQIEKNKKQNEIKIGTFGEEASGKSTTLSVIVNEKLDDGKGLMRKFNFRFQHEIVSGKTLSISHLYFGLDQFNNKINLMNNNNNLNNNIQIEEEEKNIKKIVNLYDMGGSEKALKTTLSLISSDYIDYALIFIDSKQGITDNSKILFVLNHSNHIPIITVITMIDLLDNINTNNANNILDNLISTYMKKMTEILPSIKPFLIKNKEDILNYIANISENITPIIPISNVLGTNLDLLLQLISLIPNTLNRTIPLINNNFDDKGFDFISSPHSQFDVHEHFTVEGHCIIGGLVSKGRIIKGENYFFGPNKLGNFKLLKVESIHCRKKAVDIVYEGQYISLKLSGKNYNENEIRKGMCLIGTSTIPKSVKKFKADVWSISAGNNVKEVKYKYEPVVIINHIRQTCKIKKEKSTDAFNTGLDDISNLSSSFSKSTTSKITCDYEECKDDKNLRKKRSAVNDNLDVFFISSQEKIELTFEFKNFPEYVTEGSNIIINDSNIKAFGIITKVYGF